MKIAVTAQGPDLSSPVDPHFGRARQFVVVDTETNAVEAVDNVQNVNAAHGAGIQAAQTISQLGVEVVLTGNCGPNAFRTLGAAGITICVGASGSVGEAVEAYKAGRLAPTDAANAAPHAGLM